MLLRLLCITPEEKSIGLAAVPELGENEYAKFIYNEDSTGAYWNKNVRYPIDIGFFDKNKVLVYSTSMAADQRLPVYPPVPYRYVIETNLGKLQEFAF
jgi:uncharacterized membrane protein (UPF0127 family)